ncbi:hypothetical protein KQX54_021724 [Cotesia glomerata]|uniref:Uncharacterized protein n=1 Tax=Cotesia glomerata TaxID=32391 RepID=A0AAV7JA05_COTGL|nr:hypothetical protein KQX54_021724 [Cotesia glomerata]
MRLEVPAKQHEVAASHSFSRYSEEGPEVAETKLCSWLRIGYHTIWIDPYTDIQYSYDASDLNFLYISLQSPESDSRLSLFTLRAVNDLRYSMSKAVPEMTRTFICQTKPSATRSFHQNRCCKLQRITQRQPTWIIRVCIIL